MLAEQTRTSASDPAVHKLLAQAAGKTGRTLETHMAMADYYYLNGYTKQAVEQLQLARKSPRLSDYQMARIQARLITLEKQLKDKN